MAPDPTAASRELDCAVEAFATVRPHLSGIAYRILDSATEAEDVVQECWLRWQTENRDEVRDPPALTKIFMRCAFRAPSRAGPPHRRGRTHGRAGAGAGAIAGRVPVPHTCTSRHRNAGPTGLPRIAVFRFRAPVRHRTGTRRRPATQAPARPAPERRPAPRAPSDEGPRGRPPDRP